MARAGSGACLLLAALLGSAASALPQTEPVRSELGHDVLLRGQSLVAPVDMGAFLPARGARKPARTFAGTLAFSATSDGTAVRVHRDTYGLANGAGRAILHLPAFDFEFVQSGDAIIPVRRGSLPGDDPDWEYLLEPGRAWQEPGDRGLTRVALPFALQARNANCIHNGVLTFLFGARGTVSRVAFQISSETCMYLQFDLWGLAPARHTPGATAAAARTARDYERELRARLPVKPMAALAQDHPGADAEAFGSASDIAPGDMTAFGFLIDGVHYAGGCATRHGPYPFCDVLDLPSYSLAKSIFAGVASMRLEQRFPGTSQQRIADFVPECARTGTWRDVTFGHALDMATGNYDSPVYDADERAGHTLELFDAVTHGARIAYSCGHYARREAPGARWVYHTSDTYVLGTALNAFVKQRLGATQDVFADVLVGEVWRPLGLSPVTAASRRTGDAVAQPFTGWGLVLHRDDVVRIAHWLATGRGELAGRQLLSPGMLAAALQRVPADRGLTSLGPEFRYHHGFWARDVGGYIGCAEPAWVPFMSGYGGITVALFPNGTIYYYFSDGGKFSWRRAAIAADRIRSFCPRQAGARTHAS
jgi:hypothetical protein